jgi:hypothetical protein
MKKTRTMRRKISKKMKKGTLKRKTLKRQKLKKQEVKKNETQSNIAKLYKTYGSNTSNIAFF